MSKGAKKVLGVIIIVILIVLVSWIVYRGTQTEPASINETNELPNEDMEMANEVNEINVVEEENIVEENTTESEKNVDNEDETEPQTQSEEAESSTTSSTEVVSGTKASREERAVELAKEYYENEYGSAEGIDFEVDDVDGGGRYIVRYGTANASMFLYVNLNTGTVSEK